VAFCKDPKKLSSCDDNLANLPRADAVLFPDAHPGLGVMSLRMVNPSFLTSDGLKLHVNPKLDPCNTANGFNPGGPSHYPREFQERYAKAQAVGMNDLIGHAESIRAKIAAGVLTDATADQIAIQQLSFANHLDELDPEAIGLMRTQHSRQLLRNDGSIVMAVIQSASVGNPVEVPKLSSPSASIQSYALFLSSGSVKARDSIEDIDFCTNNSITMCNVGSIHSPVLFIASGASTFIADEERMYV
jgi:hypothetical protein